MCICSSASLFALGCYYRCSGPISGLGFRCRSICSCCGLTRRGSKRCVFVADGCGRSDVGNGFRQRFFRRCSSSSATREGAIQCTSTPSGSIRGVICASVVGLRSNDRYFLVMASSVAPLAGAIRVIHSRLTVISIIFILLTIVVSLCTDCEVTGPVSGAGATTGRLTGGGCSISFGTEKCLRIRRLGRALGCTGARLTTARGLRGRLVTGVSRSLEAPLAVVANCNRIVHSLPNRGAPRGVRVVVSRTAELSALIGSLLSLSGVRSNSVRPRGSRFYLASDVGGVFAECTGLGRRSKCGVLFRDSRSICVFTSRLGVSRMVCGLIGGTIGCINRSGAIVMARGMGNGGILVRMASRNSNVPPRGLRCV